MREFPNLELRRSDLRNQAIGVQKMIGLSADQHGYSQEEMYLNLLLSELRELDYVLNFFGRSHWQWWQWALLVTVAVLSLAGGGLSLWTLTAG
jgi:hypothetical protein